MGKSAIWRSGIGKALPTRVCRLPAAMSMPRRSVRPSNAGPTVGRPGNHWDVSQKEPAMKYLCLIYDEGKKMDALSKTEADAFMAEYFAFTEGIKQSGHYIGGEALQPVQTAT